MRVRVFNLNLRFWDWGEGGGNGVRGWRIGGTAGRGAGLRGGCLENVDVVSSMSGKGRMLCVSVDVRCSGGGR